MFTKKLLSVFRVVFFGIACVVAPVRAAEIYKAGNSLPLNDPLSWEGGLVPGSDDIAVFTETVTTNTVSFLITNNLSWAGLIFTNQSETVSVMSDTIILATNGMDVAVLTLGSDGLSLLNSGLGLTLNAPLSLGAAQTWSISGMNLTFNNSVSGTLNWTLDGGKYVYWNKAPGYNGNLVCVNSLSNSRHYYYGASRWAKSLVADSNVNFELRFTGTLLWSDLFSERTATIAKWLGVENYGTLQFESGDTLNVANEWFALDKGSVVQNGGEVDAKGMFMSYNLAAGTQYTLNDGTLSVGSYGMDMGDSLYSILGEARLLQTGGIIETPDIKIGRANLKYFCAPVYEITGGVFRITGTSGADTGIHLSWNRYGTGGAECSGAFLMEGGLVDVDQVALGRSITTASYGITNAFSLFRMSGGELVMGKRGLYAGNSWNNGITNSGYAVKLRGGTLTAGESWASTLDINLDDLSGGVVFNTEDTSGNPHVVRLNGAVRGTGTLKKSGAGTLSLSGEASYSGGTVIEEGTLTVGHDDSLAMWTADSVNGTNQMPVSAWEDQNNGIVAENSDASRSPRLVLDSLNGHSVVHFDGSAFQYLSIDAANSPISGATAFSMVTVFRTETVGYGGQSHWYHNSGLIDAEQGGYQNDWGMAYNGSGQVGGGVGFKDIGDKTVYSGSENSVVDNQPHVAIFTWEGTNLSMNVDGRVTTAFSTVATVYPRNVYRMLFGSLNLLSGQYFTGDMAEIRIYRNRVLSAEEQNQLGYELALTYGVADSLFSETGIYLSTVGNIEMTPPSSMEMPAPLPYAATVWDADSLTDTNGSEVSSWVSTNGVAATLSTASLSGALAPTLLTNVINGHNAVHFDASLKNVLGVSSGDSPISGVTNFSIAFVMRTDAPGITASQWYSSVGVIDAEQGGATYDWGVAFTGDGRVAAGIGYTDSTTFSKPFDLHDGLPHVAVISYDAIGGYTRVMVDGLCVSVNVGAHAHERNAYRILFGSLNKLTGKFFTGDLATIQFYPECALTESEMTSLSTGLSLKYGSHFVSLNAVSNPKPTGLGSGDVEVYAGASLDLPDATNAPVTLVLQTIYGGGSVNGTLALSDGAAVDIGQSESLTMQTLWMESGSIVRWNHTSGIGSTLSVESLKTSGTVNVEVVGGTDLPARVSIIAYTSVDGLGETTWNVVGGKGNTQVVLNEQDKTLDLVTYQGTIIFIR